MPSYLSDRFKNVTASSCPSISKEKAARHHASEFLLFLTTLYKYSIIFVSFILNSPNTQDKPIESNKKLLLVGPVYYGDTGPVKTEDIGPGKTESLGHFPMQFYGNDLILGTQCLFLS